MSGTGPGVRGLRAGLQVGPGAEAPPSAGLLFLSCFGDSLSPDDCHAAPALFHTQSRRLTRWPRLGIAGHVKWAEEFHAEQAGRGLGAEGAILLPVLSGAAAGSGPPSKGAFGGSPEAGFSCSKASQPPAGPCFLNSQF